MMLVLQCMESSSTSISGAGNRTNYGHLDRCYISDQNYFVREYRGGVEIRREGWSRAPSLCLKLHPIHFIDTALEEL